jgi:hypothetical protein
MFVVAMTALLIVLIVVVSRMPADNPVEAHAVGAQLSGRDLRERHVEPDLAVSAPTVPQTATTASVLRRVARRSDGLPRRRR